MPLLVVAIGCVLACASADAAEHVTLGVAFSPDKLGAPTTIELNLDITSTTGGVPSPVTGFAMHIPSELELVASGLGLAVCNPTGLQRDGLSGCSPNAQLGSGTANVELAFGPEIVKEACTIYALLSPPIDKQTGVLVYAIAVSPVSATLIFPGLLYAGPAATGGTGETLATTVPPTPTLPEAPNASVTTFQLSIGPRHLTYYKKVHGKTVSYRPTGIALPPFCPHDGFPFVADLTFEDGSAVAAEADVPCPTSSRRARRKA